MLRNMIFAVGAIFVGGLGGIGHAELGEGRDLPDVRPPQRINLPIAEPAANISQASFNAENKLKPPQSTIVQTKGAATETSAVARVDPAKPMTKMRKTPQLILGVGW